MQSNRFLFPCLAASALFACSAPTVDATTTTNAAAAIDEASFAEAYAQAVCDDLGPCCARAAYSHDAARCRAAAVVAIEGFFEPLKVNGAFDPDAAARCLDGIRASTRACADFEAGSVEGNAHARACLSIFRSIGTAPLGGACAAQNDCAPVEGATALCHVTVTVEEGVVRESEGRCVAYRPAAEGMACDPDTATELGNCGFDDFTGTGDGFFCGADGRCHTRSDAGGACGAGFAGSECKLGLRCVDGACAEPAASGEPCRDEADCDAESTCAGGACAPKKRGGAPCVTAAECASSRCDVRCAEMSLATAETCGG